MTSAEGPDRAAVDARVADARVADAARGNWVDTRAPARLRPWLRLIRADRPIGVPLLMLPGWAGLALAGLAADWRLDALGGSLAWISWLFVAFFVGAVVMRGAGCVLNDLVDRDIDRLVERTRNRPLASGAITPKAALALLVALSLVGLAILASFPPAAIVVGLASAPWIAVYPFMKRFTWWPQLFLGVAFGWGALLGWTALAGAVGAPAVALYLGCIAWIVGYDTIYAHQDREDDALVGVRSTARLFGRRSRLAVGVCYAIAVLGFGLAGGLADAGPWFWLGLGAVAAHLGGQVARLDIDDAGLCLHLFRSNRDAGLLLVGAILLGAL